MSNMSSIVQKSILLFDSAALEPSIAHWKAIAANLQVEFKLYEQHFGETWSLAETAGCLLVEEDNLTENMVLQLERWMTQYPHFQVVLLGNQLGTTLQKNCLGKCNYHWLPQVSDAEFQTAFLVRIFTQSQTTLQQFQFCQGIDLSLQDLTAQSKEILQYILQGRTNKEISLQLKCSQRTIESRRQQLLKILQVENAVAMAHKLGKYSAFKSLWS
jgi:DNA-binding CsgD family transcriptional regulator